MTKPSSYPPYSILLEILKQELPLCFKRTGFKQPLKINIHKDVLAHYAEDNRFKSKRLCKAISLYTTGKAYLKTLKEGADRINLEGKVVDKVTKKQAVYANNLLKVKRFMSTQKYLKKPNSTFKSKRSPLFANSYLIKPPSSSSSTSSSNIFNIPHCQINQIHPYFDTTTVSARINVINTVNIGSNVNNAKEFANQLNGKEIKAKLPTDSRWTIISLKKSDKCKK